MTQSPRCKHPQASASIRIVGVVSALFLLLPTFYFLLPAPFASAALLFSEPRQIEVTPNQTFEVGVFLDTQNDDINAIEGILVFSSDLLELKEIRDGNSIINFWVERPVLSQTPVTFAGIIPGGYRFPKGLILSLVFQAKGNGTGTIRLENAHTLRNDGQGTETPLTLAFSSVVISDNPQFPPPAVSPIVDTIPPESFRPELSRDPSIFNNQWFLSFATQDKGSGIDHYEVRETYAWGQGSWERAESPYVMRGQNPSLAVDIKAVDRAGNSRMETTAPIKHVPSIVETIIFYGLIMLMILLVLVRRGRKDQKSKAE